MTGMGMKAYVHGRNYHKRLSLCINGHTERQLDRQGSASLWPVAEEAALNNREILFYWGQVGGYQDCKRKREGKVYMVVSQDKWHQ